MPPADGTAPVQVVRTEGLNASQSQPCADGERAARPSLGYRCCGCKRPASLNDLNAGMLCTSCGEADEDPAYLSPSEAYLRRWESTWSV